MSCRLGLLTYQMHLLTSDGSDERGVASFLPNPATSTSLTLFSPSNFDFVVNTTKWHESVAFFVFPTIIRASLRIGFQWICRNSYRLGVNDPSESGPFVAIFNSSVAILILKRGNPLTRTLEMLHLLHLVQMFDDRQNFASETMKDETRGMREWAGCHCGGDGIRPPE